MARIAIIDDWMNPRYLSKKDSVRYIPIGNDKTVTECQGEEYTHATVIMKVLELYAEDYEIMNIVLARKLNEPRDIREIRTALKVCLNEQVDIVCMSFGTDRISDGAYISDLIGQLYERDVILIASADNNGYYMLPAAMPEVIGVDLDRKGTIEAGEYIVQKKNYRNTDVAVNCNLELSLQGKRFYPSTSFAVPVIAAKINGYLNEGCFGQREVRERLRADAVGTDSWEYAAGDMEAGDMEVGDMLPVIGSHSIEMEEWIRIMDVMNRRFDIETIGVDYVAAGRDYRFLSVVDLDGHSWIGQLDFIERHTTADMILAALVDESVDCDVFIEKEKDRYRCIIPETQEDVKFDGIFPMCEWIIGVLS